MKRRQLNLILAATGIIAAILAVHTNNPPTPERNQQVSEMKSAAPDITPRQPTVVAVVTLPPPPSLAVPAPIIAPLPATAAPVQEINSMEAAPKPARQIQKNQPPVRKIEPLKAPTRPDEPVRGTQTVEPLIPERQQETAKKTRETTAKEPKKIMKMPVKAVHQTGRPLLRLLEHGDGPTVEIAWPQDRRTRSRLHHLFSQCYGMRVAVLDSKGRLFNADSPRGTPWAINTDQFSGFIRQSSSGVTLEERQTVIRIRNRHGLDLRAAAVRIFPRRADALLLGSLNQLVGAEYSKAQHIQATYQLADNQVWIIRIRVDGTPVGGVIDLSQAARRGCVL